MVAHSFASAGKFAEAVNGGRTKAPAPLSDLGRGGSQSSKRVGEGESEGRASDSVSVAPSVRAPL